MGEDMPDRGIEIKGDLIYYREEYLVVPNRR
jgi:hypothetical protein